MVVQHNMQAANASRMLGITTTAQGKTSEKLSSGFRINRAADDAAGLSISEKMRKQIRGLDQASTNASDGISAVQTAEGALTEVHSMLQRMNELAVQAANGTNSETDRGSIQDEIHQLTTEIDRVAETTKFNETYLLKGSTTGSKVTKYVKAHDAGLAGTLAPDKSNNGVTLFTLNEKPKSGDTVQIAGIDYKIADGRDVDSYSIPSKLNNTIASIGDSITTNGKTYTLTNYVKVSTITNTVAYDAAGAVTDAGKYKPSVGDKIITKDGTVYQYYGRSLKANGPLAGWYIRDDYEDTEAFAATTVASKLNAIAVDGSTIQLKEAQEGNGLKEFRIVKKMEDGDVSAWAMGHTDGKIQMNELKFKALNPSEADLAATGGAVTALDPGDSVTVDGVTTYCVGQDYDPTKVDEVAKEIGALQAGYIVKVADIDGNNDFEYTIVENGKQEKPEQSMLTRESIVALLEEGQEVSLYSVDTDGNKALISGKQFTVAEVEPDEEGTISTKKAYQLMAKELERASSIGTDNGATVLNNMDGTFTIKQGTTTHADVLNFNLHVGADADMTNKIGVTIETMNTAYLGIKGLNVADDDGISATYSIDAISDALAKVSAQRSALGAIQNRLEHSIANLDNVVENSEAAESRIRDTDMAETMVTYSKNNILAQAGQSMLAQANQSTQGVMSILQ